jgi:tetratricopeptide (TPR) repeat protein
MTRIFFLWCALPLAAVAAEDPGALFEQAEQLSRSNRKAEAMAKVEQAVARIDRAQQAGEEISWQAMNGFRFAARLAREDFLDYDKAFAFCDRFFELADNDYWRVPARLERALTYRAMGDFQHAQQEYDAIAAADPRQQTSAILPQAEMVYFEIGDPARGRDLIEQGLMNAEINSRERFTMLRKCAQHAISRGCQDEAVAWYAMLEKLPFEKADERARYLSQAWYEMGQIQESRGRTAEAKRLYRQAMELAAGEMHYRARARDALESIQYFE